MFHTSASTTKLTVLLTVKFLCIRTKKHFVPSSLKTLSQIQWHSTASQIKLIIWLRTIISSLNSSVNTNLLSSKNCLQKFILKNSASNLSWQPTSSTNNMPSKQTMASLTSKVLKIVFYSTPFTLLMVMKTLLVTLLTKWFTNVTNLLLLHF